MNDAPALSHRWPRHYPPGMRWDAPLPATPADGLLRDAVRRWPDRPALDFMGEVIDYRHFGHLVDRLAAGLQQFGVGPGVHVGLYLPNTPHYAIAFFAVLTAGGTVVNYLPLDAERVLAHKVEDSRTDILFTLDLTTLYPQMSRLLGASRLKKLVVGSMSDLGATREATRAQLSKAGQLAAVPADERHVSFMGLLDNAAALVTHPIANPADALAVLQYTGGTTGLAKGAMLTHANLSAVAEQFFITTQGTPPVLAEGQERMLVVLPLFHIYALSVCLLLGVRIGAQMVLHVRFDVDAVMADLQDKRISVFPGVPTMYSAVAQHPKASQMDLHSLKYCGSGGAPLPVEVAQRFQALTGCPLNEGWGMTETAPAGTFTPVHGLRKAGSCGMPVPGVTLSLRALDDSAREVPMGEPGELCITGPNVTKGYWNAPEANRSAFTADGFFRSGDVARMDEDGYFSIVDRTKDMLLCGGFNVYPRVIEEALYEHPAVLEACVIGIPDEYRGQSPKAFVALKPGAAVFTLKELQAFLAGRIGKHEMVQALEIRDSLPKTPVGKLSKRDLVDQEAAARNAQ
ncbi:long-chain-fatty-acid--CoA ligase [Roseateles sp.]|uniref:long-chain-fatty-acid--CoA ligase n=1 Tax=Roseateles sp. TaxID=1971397 RepID=UPI0039E9F78F